jgi:Uma2 family endonuclease
MNALTVHLNSIIDLSDEQYFQLCQANRNLEFERTATGELIIMRHLLAEKLVIAMLQ